MLVWRKSRRYAEVDEIVPDGDVYAMQNGGSPRVIRQIIFVHGVEAFGEHGRGVHHDICEGAIAKWE